MKYLALILVVLLAHSLHAQEIFIYHVRGKVKLTEGKKPAVTPAAGEIFNPSQTLWLEENAQVSVLSEKGLAIVFNKPGQYSFKKVIDEIKRSQSVMSPFYAYVWNKLKEHHGTDPALLANKAKGGVSRSEWSVSSPADSAVILSDIVIFQWHPLEDLTYLAITGENNTRMFKLASQDSSLVVFLKDSNFKSGYYNWKLSTKPNGGKSHSGVFFIPDRQWTESFKKKEEQVRSSLEKLDDQQFLESQINLFYLSQRIENFQQK